MQGTSRYRIISTGLAVVLLIIVASFAVYYTQSSSTRSSLKETITSQSSELNIQAYQLAGDNSTIESLKSNMTSLLQTVSSLQSEVRADETRITLLVARATKDNLTIGSLNSEIASLNSEVTNLNAEVTALDERVAADQSQVASLETERTDLMSVITAVDTALARPCSTPDACVPEYTNYKFTVIKGSMENFTFTAAGDGGDLVIAVVSSTSSNTTVYTPMEYGPSSGAPVNVGSSGIVVFTPEGGDTFPVYIYDQNLQGFSATVDIWYFS